MCLWNESGPIVADKDIVVWKMGRLNFEGNFYSFFSNFVYKKNVEPPRIDIPVEALNRTGSAKLSYIIYGYHSFNSKKITLVNIHFFGDMTIPIKELIIGKFIIPKGTTYYIGDDGDLVSERIIFKKPILGWFLKWRARRAYRKYYSK